MAEISRQAVLHAIEEFDAIGSDAFLKQYGFGKSRDFYVQFNGRRYDTKPLLGAAAGFMPGGRPLPSTAFSGGYSDAVRTLRSLGFEIVSDTKDMAALDEWSMRQSSETSGARNPKWTWDEHVLALELYLENPSSPPSKSSAEVIELSRFLTERAEAAGVMRGQDFRNPNGVYMKMMNFRRLDPAFQKQGKSGLSRGASGEADVWDRYAEDREGLLSAAAVIRNAASTGTPVMELSDSEVEGAEGSTVVRLHVARERNQKLVRQKKVDVRKRTGGLACECCLFNFQVTYGEIGEDFIEVHHTNPLALSEPGRVTKLNELAVVCANCHRMLHRRGLISLNELQLILSRS